MQVRVKSMLLLIFMLLTALVMILPFLWTFITSLKESSQVFTLPPRWMPSNPTLKAYFEVFEAAPLFWRYMLNSTIVVGSTVMTHIFLGSLAGYTFAKFRFRGQDILFIVILITLMIPPQISVVPLFLLIYRLGWLDTYKALIIPRLVTAYTIFLMRQYMKTLPDALIEAGRIDGCSEFGIYFRIILPLCKPLLAAVAIITFVGQWNDFLWPLLVVRRDALKTIQLALAMWTRESDVTLYWNVLAAASILAFLPTLVVFLSLQKYFTGGIVLSGMKG